MPQTAPRSKPRSTKKKSSKAALPMDGEALLRWIDTSGVEHRHAPGAADTAQFHLNRPVRKFGRYPGMKNFPGLYWAATTNHHVGHESWNERAWAMVLDFDPAVVGIVSQPFQLIGREMDGCLWRHTPDYLAERRGRPRLVIDIRPEDKSSKGDFLRLVDLTRPICETLGWEYRVVHQVPDQLLKNIDFLSAYRRPFPDPLGLRPQLLEAASEPLTPNELCGTVGEPILVLPQLFRLCWQSLIQWDLRLPLRYFSTKVAAVTEPSTMRRAA